MDAFARLVRSLVRERVRFVVIGLSGANYYARSGGDLFVTQDRDLYLPLDPANVLAAWKACEAAGFDLLVGREPLDQPRDRRLAERVVATRALVRATNGAGLDVDLTLVMTGFDFDRVWAGRRLFRVDEVEIPVARLRHIVESKRLTGRQKGPTLPGRSRGHDPRPHGCRSAGDVYRCPEAPENQAKARSSPSSRALTLQFPPLSYRLSRYATSAARASASSARKRSRASCASPPWAEIASASVAARPSWW
jgi:hypothetical protein